MKIVTIVGARPQFIKAAAVSRAIAESNRLVTSNSSPVTEVIVHTGQHYDRNMSDVFFEEMNIPRPDYFLDINGLSHGAMTGQMLEKIEEVLIKEGPYIVLVYGDTNTTLAGALAAVKLHIPVAHVEAGLRSFNRRMPEEINRVVTDHISAILFCPTKQSVENLNVEGIGEGILVALVGDVMYDSVLYYSQLADKSSQIIEKLKLKPKDYGLATVHRAENTNNIERLKSIFLAFEKISIEGLPIIVPVHPRTQQILKTAGMSFNNVQLIDPVSYLDMLLLEKQAQVILTDSGGVQKEAYWMNVPCITLRDETEWVETVEHGWNLVSGTDCEKIIHTVKNIKIPELKPSLYGNGEAAEQIVAILKNHTEGNL